MSDKKICDNCKASRYLSITEGQAYLGTQEIDEKILFGATELTEKWEYEKQYLKFKICDKCIGKEKRVNLMINITILIVGMLTIYFGSLLSNKYVILAGLIITIGFLFATSMFTKILEKNEEYADIISCKLAKKSLPKEITSQENFSMFTRSEKVRGKGVF
jgi:hypothetical protein